LAAQPAALTIAVSFTESVKPHLTVLRNDYNGAQDFVLAAVLEIAAHESLRGCAGSVLIGACLGTSG
jgi:hypothetical protein